MFLCLPLRLRLNGSILCAHVTTEGAYWYLNIDWVLDSVESSHTDKQTKNGSLCFVLFLCLTLDEDLLFFQLRVILEHFLHVLSC